MIMTSVFIMVLLISVFYLGSKDNQFPMELMTSKLHGKVHGSDGQGLLGGARVCFLSKFSRLI